MEKQRPEFLWPLAILMVMVERKLWLVRIAVSGRRSMSIAEMDHSLLRLPFLKVHILAVFVSGLSHGTMARPVIFWPLAAPDVIRMSVSCAGLVDSASKIGCHMVLMVQVMV